MSIGQGQDRRCACSIPAVFNANADNKRIQVVFFTPGEGAADGYTGYLTNRTITGLFAQAIQGAVVILERKCRIPSIFLRQPSKKEERGKEMD